MSGRTIDESSCLWIEPDDVASVMPNGNIRIDHVFRDGVCVRCSGDESMNVTVKVPPRPWPELVDYLREKLAQAEAGQLAAVAIVFEYDGGETGHYAFKAERSYPMKLVGELEAAKFAILSKEKR